VSFSDDINKFTKKVEKQSINMFKGTVLDLFGRIVKRTPVGNPDLWVYNHPQLGYVDYLTYKDPPEGYTGGSLRANWQLEINKPAQGTIEGVKKPSPMKANRLKLGDTAYITNNLPHAKPVENGWSSQRPEGMVKVTVNEFKNIAKIQTLKAKK